MKYFIKNNMDYKQDDYEVTESLLFSTPDDFEFDIEKIKAFCEFKNWDYAQKTYYRTPYIEVTELFPYGKKGKTRKVTWIASFDNILGYVSDIRKELIDWLEKTYGVVQLKTIELRDV